MSNDRYKLKDLIFSLDIGTRSIIGSVGVIKDNKFNVICEKYKEHEERAMVDGQIHDINLVAKTVEYVKKALEEELKVKLKSVSIAAAGRFLRTSIAKSEISLNGDEEINKDIIRSLELSAVKKAEEEVCSDKSGKLYCVGYSVKAYYLNSYIISNLLGHKGENIAAEVIATFLPRSVVDSLYAVVDKVNLEVMNLTLEPIAAIEAAVPQKLRLLNIALVDIGAGTSDIAISSKETITAFGMVPMAGDEVTEAIAQEYLLDFNTAEAIKREINIKDEIKYTDVLGIENKIESNIIKKLIAPIIKKIGETVAKKIIELNGDKPPAAVFLVGGGAHTPLIMEEIADNLNLSHQRIAIKDRLAVEECVCNNELGSAGVTVLGIALTAIKKMGDNFIDVDLNGEIISLFNSHKNTVLDVLIQAGIKPSLLIGKNGKSKRFTLNGKKRIVFGELGKNAKIIVNGKEADTETEVKVNDKIEVTFAKNGNEAIVNASNYIGEINSISVYIDDKIINIEPICIINNEIKPIDSKIKNKDEVKIFLPNNIEDFKKYILKEKKSLYKNNILLEGDYTISDGEKIFTKKNEDTKKEEPKIEKEELILNVIVNNESIKLMGKKTYLFVDIFNYIDFDINTVRGKYISLKVNDEKATYTQELQEGDKIEVEWIK